MLFGFLIQQKRKGGLCGEPSSLSPMVMCVAVHMGIKAFKQRDLQGFSITRIC